MSLNYSPSLSSLKDMIATALTPFCRGLVRYGYSAGIRKAVWETLCEGRIARRPYHFTARTRFGSLFTGDAQDMLSQFIYYFGVWEPDISHWILERLTSGATFIDIGANVGYYSLLASTRVGPSGRVVAIEAAPLNYGNLLRNISINYLRNIRAVNVACWRCEDSLDLFCGPPSHSGITTVIPDFAANRGCEVFQKIQARPLASILTHEEATLARLVKIDVEGAEPEVIEGMKPLLNEFPESVEFIIEINPDQIASSGKTVETVLAPFLEGGFHVYQISNNYSPGSYLDRDLTSRIGSPVRVSLSSRLLESQCDVILSRLDQRNL